MTKLSDTHTIADVERDNMKLYEIMYLIEFKRMHMMELVFNTGISYKLRSWE